MKADLSRRDALRLAALGAVGATLVGCSQHARWIAGDGLPPRLALPDGPTDPLVRLAGRTMFGPRPGDLARIAAMGPEAFVEEQLAASVPEPPDLVYRLSRLDVLRIDGMELRDIPEDEMVRQLQQAALLRAVYSPNQLREKLADFWTNHFNVFARKGLASYRLARDQQNVVRRHALGSFPAMVRASAHSPAMLAYLDNRVNRKGIANENYARELMELHTLGVDGGYTQRDVQEVARCFTGWTIENRFLRPAGRFRFDPALHDDGEKIVLGRRIPPGGGKSDGDQVLDILVRHPATARHIAAKLCARFVGEAPEPLVNRIAKVYLDTGGDIASMARATLASPEFQTGPPIAKRPLDYVTSALRATNADSDCGRAVQRHLEAMGQPLHQWPMPDGYPNAAAAWTGSLLARWNFAFDLLGGRIQGAVVALDRIERRAERAGLALASEIALGRPLVETSLARLTDPVSDEAAFALALAAPEFQWM
jgi:uncharacterized protein (DUF1800 family)